jgi:hypothetical protein
LTHHVTRMACVSCMRESSFEVDIYHEKPMISVCVLLAAWRESWARKNVS